MSEENINIATKEYADAHFGNTSETNGDLVIATKEYVDSIPIGMVIDGTALKGQLYNHYFATAVGDGADGSTLTDGTKMFYQCSNLASFTVPLPNLTNGSCMFRGCTGLTSWTVELPNLTNGEDMFDECSGLTSWTVELPNLTDGEYMFYYCSRLTSWTVELPNLTNGSYMFDGCYGLTSWTVDLPNLTNGYYMFNACYNLTSFSGELPKLAYGADMFYGCILNEDSILNILNSIPAYTSGTHSLHLGKRTNYQTSGAVAAKLRTSTGGTVSTPIPAATNYRCVDDDGNDKGWTITVQA